MSEIWPVVQIAVIREHLSHPNFNSHKTKGKVPIADGITIFLNHKHFSFILRKEVSQMLPLNTY
jgi:hypothetical protein